VARIGAAILTATADLADAQKNEEHAKGASARIAQAREERNRDYETLIKTYTDEEEVLRRLYKPLEEIIQSDQRLAKFSVRVKRNIDVKTWLATADEMFNNKFSGIESPYGTQELQREWGKSSDCQIGQAMKSYIGEMGKKLAGAFKKDFHVGHLGEWLFSDKHFKVHYAVEFGGVALDKLSPGTKGIVLLILYLALDRWDNRPLLIDQPEDNLDPRSIFDLLVPFFREAATRRQVIMVTHNANLVVNTDSDQVIIADASPLQSSELPLINYVAGGLEDESIRKQVCAILEGGEAAFQKRALRYTIKRA